MEESYGEESRASSEPSDDQLLTCPSFRSYSSLELLTCSEIGEDDECRLVKLNNTIKKLSDLIDDPINREDTTYIACLLCKFLRYNGSDGYYVKHLPQIGEILEFVALRARMSSEYLDILYQLLELCSKPLLLHRTSEILTCAKTLRRYVSFLGYLMILVPTRQAFIMAKTAIEGLVTHEKSKKRRRDAVKPDARREAVEASRLPVTLDELAEVVSDETYPDILEIILALVSVSQVCCKLFLLCLERFYLFIYSNSNKKIFRTDMKGHRFLETGIVNQIMLKMHPSYACECPCIPDMNNTDLQLDKKDYYKSLELSVKILWRLMKSRILSIELTENSQNSKSPSQAALRSLRASFRREVLRAGRSSRSRKLRNELANLILANLMQQSRGSGSTWKIVESGIADDIADLVVATEFGTCSTWAETAIVEADALTGLTFKKTLLLSIALIVESQPNAAKTLKNKRIVSGVLQLVDLFAATKTPWNPEQLWHLFKYALNALTFLSPKIADEFIENCGSLRLLSLLQRFTKVNYDEHHVIYLAETMCSLSSVNCDAILVDFREHDFISVILKLIERILGFDAFTKSHQEIVTFLLVTIENIVENQKHLKDCNSISIIKTAVYSLKKCLYQKPEDSELKQIFLVAIGSFIWKCLADHPATLNDFLLAGGLYLILDLVAGSELPVQNLYLGLLENICKNETCNHYLFSWRCADKSSGFVSLLANIWREEERTFGVERTPEGCIQNLESPIMNDEQWLYLYSIKSVRSSKTVVTSATGPARPKIYNLLKLMFCNVNSGCRKTLMDGLSLEDRITMLTIDAYAELKASEATLEITGILEQTLKASSSALDPSNVSQKLLARATRIRDDQGKLLELRLAEESQAELDEFRKIRHSRLNPTFDALRELSFVGRTSRREYLLEKIGEMRRKAVEATRDVQTLCRTFDSGANVSTVFGQRLRVKSISKPDKTKDEVSMVSPSTSPLSPGVSLCSLVTAVSDSSFLRRTYEFDQNGNVRVKA
ncbi:hypothetical protein TSAR_007122 [Trichomalopsis sarcophagae]|uniref:Cilia- and flagella-associated protein 69 ARM repeats domain-containing protein n=1 Tax=Trichomalopsis sarcophagae TaxID=543379 RepID=A0A232F6P8_9HYME|nr:hypothetical protein TSAR_007122 [Trichomalopsis sarcophagae]